MTKIDHAAESFQSKLKQGRDRFLSYVIQHGLDIGGRTPEDFIRHFSPAAIMEALRDNPSRRASILTITTGVKHKIAVKKSAESAGEDLQIALDEGEADAETIVTLFDPDDRVRFLEAGKLWAYITEDEFWAIGAGDTKKHEIAKEHIAYILDRALAEDLLTHRDIVDGITVGRLAELLPRAELGKVIAAALAASHDAKPYTELDMMREVPSSTLVQHVPTSLLWDRVVMPKIAGPQGFAGAEEEPSKSAGGKAPAQAAKPKPKEPASPSSDQVAAKPTGNGKTAGENVTKSGENVTK